MGGMEKEEKLDSAEDITGEVEMYWRQELTIYDVRVVEKREFYSMKKSSCHMK